MYLPFAFIFGHDDLTQKSWIFFEILNAVTAYPFTGGGDVLQEAVCFNPVFPVIGVIGHGPVFLFGQAKPLFIVFAPGDVLAHFVLQRVDGHYHSIQFIYL